MPHSTPEIWFVYDGDCPLCTFGSNHWRVQEVLGTLHILDARENGTHPLLKEINAKKINLDEGMVIKFQDHYYHGVDALHAMALLGTRAGWFNRMNAYLFRSKLLSRICYPFMRAARRLALLLKGAPLIHNLKPQ